MMKRVASLALLISLLTVLLIHEVYYDHLADDAFISFRYIWNFASGYGLVYNIGERVEGYTNFLWVLLLSPAVLAGLDVVFVARFAGALLSLLVVIAVYAFSNFTAKMGTFTSLIAATLLICNAAYAVWALSGMETTLFTFLVFLAFHAFVVEWGKTSFFPLSAFLFALAALTRPEALLLFGISALFRVGRDLGARKAISRETLAWTGLFLVVYVPYFMWRWQYYGWLLPNTFYAKVGGDYYAYIRGLFYCVKFVSAFGGLFLFALPLALFLDRRVPFWVWYALALSLAFVAYIIYVGGDGLVCSRFFVPILPLIYLLVQAGFHRMATSLQFRVSGATRARFIVGLLAATMFVGTLNASYNVRREPYADVVKDREMVRNLVRVGQYLRENSKPGDSIALAVAGAIPYYSKLYTIDMLGLTDVHIAHKEMPHMGHGSAGHEKSDWDYVISREPTYIITDWPTPQQQTKEPMVTSGGNVYVFRSVRIGEGMFWRDFGLHQAELWFNYWELSGTGR